MLRRLEPIAATDPPPDGCTPPRPRWNTALCWRNAARSTELRNVSWLHIPKTGSTFARLIFRAACGVVPANRSHELFTEASAMHPIIALACPGAFRYFASWHTPLSQAAADECGTHQRHCVSVVRAPAERVESGFYHAMHDCTWLQQAHGLSESGLNRTFYATFADETPKLYAHCVGGCSSRMLTGRPCGRCRPDAVSDVEGCIRRVWREAIGTEGAPYLDAILQRRGGRRAAARASPTTSRRTTTAAPRRACCGASPSSACSRRGTTPSTPSPSALACRRSRATSSCRGRAGSRRPARRSASHAPPRSSAPSGARTAPTRSSCAPPRRGCSRISRGIGRRAERRSRRSTVTMDRRALGRRRSRPSTVTMLRGGSRNRAG